MNDLILWFVVFLGAQSFVFSLKTQSTNGYIFYTLSFAACTATAVVTAS